MGLPTTSKRSIANVSVNYEKRYICSEWMYQVAEKLFPSRKISRTIFHHSVHILDKILLIPFRSPCFPFPNDHLHLQLLGLWSIIVSLRILYRDRILPSLSDFTSFYGFVSNEYTFQEFIACGIAVENLKLHEIQIDIAPQYLDQYPNESLQSLSLVLMDSYLLEHSSGKFSPNIVAAAALAVSKKLLKQEVALENDLEIKQMIQNDFSPLKQCFDEIFYVAYTLFKEDEDSIESSSSTTSTEKESSSMYKNPSNNNQNTIKVC